MEKKSSSRIRWLSLSINDLNDSTMTKSRRVNSSQSLTSSRNWSSIVSFRVLGSSSIPGSNSDTFSAAISLIESRRARADCMYKLSATRAEGSITIRERRGEVGNVLTVGELGGVGDRGTTCCVFDSSGSSCPLNGFAFGEGAYSLCLATSLHQQPSASIQ